MNKRFLAFLKQHTQLRTFHPGEIVFYQDAPSEQVYYVMQGVVLTYVVMPNGKQKNLFLSSDNQLLELSAFMNRKPHRTYGVALETCAILCIGRDLFAQAIQYFPEITEDLFRALSAENSLLTEKIIDGALFNADVRIARFICRQIEDHPQAVLGSYPVIPYTQSIMADIIGVSRSQVNEVFQQFSENGWMTVGYGKAIILMPEEIRLFAYAESGEGTKRGKCAQQNRN